jgi:hypothetical protein
MLRYSCTASLRKIPSAVWQQRPCRGLWITHRTICTADAMTAVPQLIQLSLHVSGDLQICLLDKPGRALTSACKLERAQDARNARGLLPHSDSRPLEHGCSIVQHRRLPCYLVQARDPAEHTCLPIQGYSISGHGLCLPYQGTTAMRWDFWAQRFSDRECSTG